MSKRGLPRQETAGGQQGLGVAPRSLWDTVSSECCGGEVEDTRVGCPVIVLEGKGMVGRGWGCTWSQVRSPLKHLVFVMRPWGAVVQMLVRNGRRTDEAWRQEKVKSSPVLAEEGLGPLNRGKEDKGRRR